MSAQNTKIKNSLMAAILLVAFVELLRTAWITDDAAITLRSVLNFIHGYGATFNVAERVQAYTHPLWFLLISALSALIGNVFTSTFLLSIIISLTVLLILMSRIAMNFWAGILSACVLILSKAYVDFSTSGLENPLSHLLVLAAVIWGLRAIEGVRFADMAAFFLACSLLYLSRPDLTVLVSPLALLIIYKAYQTSSRTLLRAILIGVLPVLAWTAFSIFYYGFPLPNTAYAKLFTGIPIADRFFQGVRYLLDSVVRDPITLGLIATGMVIGLRSSLFGMALAGGSFLYLAYVVSIGGDFMSGRLLTAPLLVAAVLVARSDISKQQLRGVAMAVGALGIMGINNTLLSDATYDNQFVADGIADERGFYFQKYGLLTAKKETFISPDWAIGAKSVSVVCGGLGFSGITQGPSAHIIDNCALADPLLARLPAKYNPNWRIGHFIRQLPTDYRESIENDMNMLRDPATRDYYESIRKITRGSLCDMGRLREIAKMNLGRVQKPDWNMYRYQDVPRSSPVRVYKKT